MNNDLESKIAIFRNEAGDIEVNVIIDEETVWLTQAQIAELFAKERSVITKHISKVLREKELEDSVCAKFAHTGADGKVYQTQYYNLDMIISVGYRVNSKRGVEFRRWANTVLKEYIIKGYSINQKKVLDNKLHELKQVVSLLSNTLINQNLVNETGQECLSLIKNYTKTWDLLLKYDENRLKLPESERKTSVALEYRDATQAISSLKKELMDQREATDLFGRERDQALRGIIGNLYQTFDGKELYPSIHEKASHLIYFVIKDHPFSDGNKRIGCLLFLLFLQINRIRVDLISPEALTALALLIAESNPDNKEIVIKLIANLLNEG